MEITIDGICYISLVSVEEYEWAKQLIREAMPFSDLGWVHSRIDRVTKALVEYDEVTQLLSNLLPKDGNKQSD
jgi:hypothetical protein